MPQQTAPYGDIFLAGTPSLDRTSALLYQEQRQRQAKAAQDNAAAEGAMQKEFANVRSADVPDLVDAYTKYKGLKKQVLFDKDLQKDPKKFAAAQQQANEALSDVHSLINGSKELKDQYKGLNTAHGTHPDNFVDNYGELISAAQSTPLKQLKAHKLGDLANLDTFLYKGPDQDFSKIMAGAAGTQKPTGYTERVPLDKNGLTYNESAYEFGNTPKQYSDYIQGALGAHKAGKAASFLWNHVPQTERDKVDQEFAAIPADKWNKMGIPVPQDLPTNTGNDALDFSNYQAKKYALANEPRAKVTPRTDAAKKFEMETNRMKQMEALRHADAKDLIDYKKKIDPNDKELNNLWIDTYIQNIKKDALNTPPAEYKYQDGRKVYEHDIPLDPTLATSLQKAGITPTFMRVMSDGKFRIVYAQTDDKGKPITGENGKVLVDKTLSVPITEEQLAVNLGKKNVTGKARAKEIINVQNNQGTKPTKPKADPLGLF
jgi:hypothetical protein